MNERTILTAGLNQFDSAESDDSVQAIELTAEDLAQVAGGRKVNEYEGQH